LEKLEKFLDVMEREKHGKSATLPPLPVKWGSKKFTQLQTLRSTSVKI
jgi:hypothetical protein